MSTSKVGAPIAAQQTRATLGNFPGWIAAGIGAFIVFSTLYGVYRFYSPVPWWDEWDGYVGFYMAATNGVGAHAWWYPHMEHRIVTSRILFYLDLRYFHGNHILLFAAQSAMLAGIVGITQRAYSAGRASVAPTLWVMGLGCGLMFSFVQFEVLKWAFETQVLAAYFFAVASFYVYSRFDSNQSARVIGALALAALAEFSMGNGIGAPITVASMAVISRRPIKEAAICWVMAALLVASYGYGYVSPPIAKPHFAPYDRVSLMAQFFVAFLGSPLAAYGLTVSLVGGLVTTAVAVIAVVGLYVRRAVTPYRAFLIATILFVFASAAAASLGRCDGGPANALASRYTTGPLLVWFALFLLCFDVLRARLIVLGSVALLAALIGQQAAVRADNQYRYDWKLALLAQKIGLEHLDLTKLLFPLEAHSRFVDYAAYSAAHRLGIYAEPWLRDAGEVKYDAAHRDDSWCRGHIDLTKRDAEGQYVSGWAVGPASNLLVVVTDEDGQTVGYGVTGKFRPDVRMAYHDLPATTGWTGFAKPTNGPVYAYAYDHGRFCKLHGPE